MVLVGPAIVGVSLLDNRHRVLTPSAPRAGTSKESMADRVRDSAEPARLDSFGETPTRPTPEGFRRPPASSCGRTDAIAVITRQVCDQRGARLGVTALAPDGADIQGVVEQRFRVSCPHCRYRATPPPVARRGQRANHCIVSTRFGCRACARRIVRRFRRSCNTGEGSDRQAGPAPGRTLARTDRNMGGMRPASWADA